MVVVVIITISAGLAIPTVVYQLRERNTQRLAMEISAAYRNARTDAMARGGAVLVRFSNGQLSVRQARQGGSSDACAELPVAQCNRAVLADWDDGSNGNRVVQIVEPRSYQGGGAPLRIQATHGGDDDSTLDVCFTPLGRAFVRDDLNARFAIMTTPATLDVHRVASDQPLGLRRLVTVQPNGATRLGTATVGAETTTETTTETATATETSP